MKNNKIIEASIIYDKATDVGYPALPMDVSLAEALITSLKFDYKPISNRIDNWETKLYYNTITHTILFSLIYFFSTSISFTHSIKFISVPD